VQDQKLFVGFMVLLARFTEPLKHTEIPDKQAVLAILNGTEVQPISDAMYFLNHGGTVEAMDNMVFEVALDWDEVAGNGYPYIDEHEKKLKVTFDELPECRNDFEYGFVSQMCGYENVRKLSAPESW